MVSSIGLRFSIVAAGESAPAVGTNTLIATSLARPPWSGGADAQVVVWDDRPGEHNQASRSPAGGPVTIARVASAKSAAGALRRGVSAVWVERTVEPIAAIEAIGHETAQLVLDVDLGGGGDRLRGGAGLADLARLAAAQGLAPVRLALAVRADPGSDIPAVLRLWRADPGLCGHPLVVVIPMATPAATRVGLVAAAVMARASVATDDVRGARRVFEVLLTIAHHSDMARHSDGERHGDEGDQR